MKIKHSQLIIFGFFFVIFFIALQQTQIPPLHRYLELLCKFIPYVITLILLILEIYYRPEFNLKTVFLLLVFLALIIFNVIFTHASVSLLLIPIYIYLCRDIDYHDLFKTYAFSIFLAVGITVLFALANIVILDDGSDRNLVGFIYTTFGPNLFFHAVLALIVGFGRKINLFVWIVLLLFNHWFYIQTNTVAVYVLIYVCFIIFYLIKFSKFFRRNPDSESKLAKSKVLGIICEYFIVFAAIFTFIIQYIYNASFETEFMFDLNKALSNRLSMGRRIMNMYDVSLFGQQIEWITYNVYNSINLEDYFYVDSSYLQIIFQHGILIFGIFLYIFIYISKYAWRKKDFFFTICIIMFLIHCITDPQLFSIRYDFFLVSFIPAYLYVTNKEYEEVEVEVVL